MIPRTLLALIVLAPAAMPQPEVSGRARARLEKEVRHELVMLPYYGVFDDLAFKVDGYNVTLLGHVTRPTLKSDAENVVKSIEGVERIDNQIEVLPLSPNDDRIRRAVYRAIYGNSALSRYALAAVPSIHIVVKNGNVNALRFVSGAGIIVDSSRTLSTNPLWYYVNVRLLFNFVKTSLRQSLRWVVQEPNSTELWQKVKINSVTPFLMGLWRKGAFGPGAPGDVFTVKCDADNNTPANIQQGIFTVEVYFYPSRPAETVIIVVGQQEGGGSAKEA